MFFAQARCTERWKSSGWRRQVAAATVEKLLELRKRHGLEAVVVVDSPLELVKEEDSENLTIGMGFTAISALARNLPPREELPLCKCPECRGRWR